MVGWIPCDPLLRKAKMGGFLQRVEKSQEFGPRDVPVILQYDDRCGDMRPWCWYATFRPTKGDVLETDAGVTLIGPL